MRKLFLLLTFVAITFPLSAYAQTSIGVVDVQLLMTQSKAAKDIQEQLKKQREKMLGELSKQEQKLAEMERSLIQDREKISKEEFSEKVKEFQKDKNALQKKSLEYRKTLNEASLGAENKLRGEIIEVIGKLADQREFDLVISKQNVVIGERDIDISEEALKMLNKEVSSIKVKF